MFASLTESFVNDSLLQPMQHLSQSLLQFGNIMAPLLIAAALFPDLLVFRIQTKGNRPPHIWQDEF